MKNLKTTGTVSISLDRLRELEGAEALANKANIILEDRVKYLEKEIHLAKEETRSVKEDRKHSFVFEEDYRCHYPYNRGVILKTDDDAIEMYIEDRMKRKWSQTNDAIKGIRNLNTTLGYVKMSNVLTELVKLMKKSDVLTELVKLIEEKK